MKHDRVSDDAGGAAGASASGGPKVGHVPLSDLAVELVSIDAVRPSPHNDLIYRPADPDDPDLKAMAASVREHGILVPLVVTLDHYILSGHRRYAAARMAGLTAVPVCREPIRSTDDAFIPLLREHNRQRVKSLDEVVREEVVTADPGEAHRLLVEHRRPKPLAADAFAIAGRQCRKAISPAKAPFLAAILRVIDERRDFWPLTDRQVHYGLLNDPPLTHAGKPDSRYANDHRSYKSLCELLTRARLAGLVPWAAVHDPTRPVVTWDVFPDPAPFVRGQLDGFLKGYYRDYLKSQPDHVELVGEKNTIDNVIRPVAMEFCVPLTLGRGYASIHPRHEMARRFRASGKGRLVLLVVSDFDPEGEDIAHSFARSMRDDFGVGDVYPVKVALTAAQVRELGLPPQMKAKAGSSRRKRFVEAHGDDVFELEAVPPARLQQMVRDAIDAVIDTDLFNAEVDAESADALYLSRLRANVHKLLGGAAPDLDVARERR